MWLMLSNPIQLIPVILAFWPSWLTIWAPLVEKKLSVFEEETGIGAAELDGKAVGAIDDVGILDGMDVGEDGDGFNDDAGTLVGANDCCCFDGPDVGTDVNSFDGVLVDLVLVVDGDAVVVDFTTGFIVSVGLLLGLVVVFNVGFDEPAFIDGVIVGTKEGFG